MKKLTCLFLLFVSLHGLAATQRVEIMGMVCAFCAQGIEKSLQTIDDVDDIYVNIDNYFVVIESTSEKGIPDEIDRKSVV